MTASKFYTGIGSRQTPPEILKLMTTIAAKLADEGWTLRSGGAPGADAAFEYGLHDLHPREIYLPWKGFNGHPNGIVMQDATVDMARAWAQAVHPAWDRLTVGGRKLHTRNAYQVLGRTLAAKSRFVVCWTPGGRLEGGTATALRLAERLSIPVFNLALEEHRTRLTKWTGFTDPQPGPRQSGGMGEQFTLLRDADGIAQQVEF